MNSPNGTAKSAPRKAPSGILLVRLSAMGDIIHVLPAFGVLRRAFPEARIDWLIEERFASLIRDYPGLNGLIRIPRRKGEGSVGRYWQILRELRRNAYDVTIDFQGLTKSALWGLLAGIPVRVGYGDPDGREISKVFYNRKVIPSPTATHVIERNLSLAQSVAGKLGPAGMEFPVDPAGAEKAESLWRERGLAGGPVVGICPGTGWRTKTWPAGRFEELARWLTSKGWKCLVLWGPGEESLAGEIESVEPRVVVAPPTSFRELAELIRRTGLFVAGDTGPLHLAAFLGIPCIGLYGASDPQRNGPYGVPARIITVDCAEAPCWKTRCPKGDSACLDALTTDRVIREIETFLDETKSLA
jgi:lipopolysaccharide heptosyltransferase I